MSQILRCFVLSSCSFVHFYVVGIVADAVESVQLNQTIKRPRIRKLLRWIILGENTHYRPNTGANPLPEIWMERPNGETDQIDTLY